MPRPIKEGLDYFELDCQMDEKFELIEAEFGLKGFAIVVKLYQCIYGKHGYYCEWTPDISLLWASRHGGSLGGATGDVGRVSEEGALPGFPKNFINEVVAASIRRDIFSEELFHRYHILTSSGIQKRYLNAVTRRGKVEMKKEYLLINVDENRVYVNNNSINVNNNSINADRNTQSRVEESRVDKSREGNINIPHAVPAKGVTATSMIEERHFPADVEASVKSWVAYKIEKRQRYKETGLKALLSQIENKIKEYGSEPVVDVIQLSMSQNWQGIVWDKLSHGAAPPAATKNSDYDPALFQRLVNERRNYRQGGEPNV